MKYALLILGMVFCSLAGKSAHITGGEMFYDYIGPTAGGHQYRITLRLFRDDFCTTCADMPLSVSIGVYDNGNNMLVGGSFLNVGRNSMEAVPLDMVPNCITNPPNLMYSMGTYIFTVVLPENSAGYTAVYQTCCRIDGIMNVPNSTGATFSTEIPGTNRLPSGTDSSPRFNTSISVVCHNNPFTLDFSAVDPNPGDSLVYSLCSAYNGGAASDAGFSTPAPPPYGAVNYIGGFSGTTPLGNQATINPTTGIISGIAPNAGRYVVSVCVDVYRNNRFIGTHKKDFIITVAPCDYASAELDPEYFSCDGFTVTIVNNSNSPLNETFYWDFGVPGTDTDVSTDEFPTFTYPDTGVYTIKLVVNRNLPCSDSTTALISVFPGFFPEFDANDPMCVGNPVQFRDMTTANYGVANTWKWDFGVAGNTDTSTLKNPAYTYTTTGTFNTRLIVTSTKGCIDTIIKPVSIVDKPEFSVTFSDTLICIIDTLQLRAVTPGAGNIQWSPNYNISNINSFTPLVSPDVTTTYIATYSDDFGCVAVDSVVVNVISQVVMDMPPDTSICLTDSMVLPLQSNALRFEWTPADAVSDPTIMNPVTTPSTTTDFTVTGYVGNCTATDRIRVRPVPYPNANANDDVTLCLGQSTTLTATGGSHYSWRPISFLDQPERATVNVSNPEFNVTYIVRVTDTLGCPKPVFDTVHVEVINLVADAGPQDTAIVLGQPLQLQGTGGDIYKWTPSTSLSNPDIAGPVANPSGDINYVLTVSNAIGCSDSDSISVKVFNLDPDFYVPGAFTPDGDGLNDRFRPIALGMRAIGAFRVYNRWGELIYSSSTLEDGGWDGRLRGAPQAAGTYIWYAEGITYRNQKITRKGSVILIR